MESNNISCYRDNSTGILAVSSSTINMGNIGDLVAGGNNVIINMGADCKNISLNNSVFEMNYGSNSFEVNNTQGNFNLIGNGNFHPGDDGPVLFIEVIGNCFNGEGYFARDSVTELNGIKDSLLELPHYCNTQQDMIVDFLVPVTNGITDTVYKSTMPQYQNSTPAELLNKKFNKNLLKRNYDSTKILGLQILTNYTDSVFVPNIISQLYFAYTRLGNISTNIPALKTFLEQLILNHPNNLTLVRSANYYIQKCKVHLHQYTSALDGYQDIMVQNPYSYEGLLASWDYAATLLLSNTGGAYSNKETDELNTFVSESQYLIDSLRMNKLMRNDSYDCKLFSKEDRKTLIKSVGNVLKEEREKQILKVKTLEEKLTKSDGKEKADIKLNLEEIKNLNSLIKTKRPKDNIEYQAILNNDIEKLHPRKNADAYSGNNMIPQTFELYQN
ncbi:MAG: hypothetical protein L0Y76_13420, partial [Ignavibacteria bacterium]|nr:hypothetical protein [Ignavibacteria bacterium]